jgi:hypothetical protein
METIYLFHALDPLVTPAMFAETICQDFDLPVDPFAARIAGTIQDRVRETEVSLLPQTASTLNSDSLSEEDVEWWKRMRQEALLLDENAAEEDRPLPAENLMMAKVGDMPYDLRIKIQVGDDLRQQLVGSRI